MILRLSQELNTEIKASGLSEMPLDENPHADWSCHLFTAKRTQYVIVTNTKLLYFTILYGKGITDDSRFIDRALSSLREFTESDGQELACQKCIAPLSATANFAKALNRSVTGSMNDMIYHAPMWLIEKERSPCDVGFQLNKIPMSALEYQNPKKASRI